MTTPTLFPVESAVAGRQPKTDRLVLAGLLKAGGKDERFDHDQLHVRLQPGHELIQTDNSWRERLSPIYELKNGNQPR